MTFYNRFEQVIAITPGIAIAVVVIVSLWELMTRIGSLLAVRTLDPLDQCVDHM
ncbi:MAG: hypothetical protein L3J84_08950 [Gammaproteobacteria bacterium]|nr:hypothetical protein [Gammaproteobacteria bacterium]